MTRIPFLKMHGLGNDFIIITDDIGHINFTPADIQRLSHRQLGIGFDQLLLLKTSASADAFCDIFNADGSRARQCGNGLRCVTKYLQTKTREKDTFSIETIAGVFTAKIIDEFVEIEMGTPIFSENSLQIKTDPLSSTQFLTLGNPHAIIKVIDLDQVDIEKHLRNAEEFGITPSEINIGFMQIIDASHIVLRTIERGVGETHACGSNACAAVAAGIKAGNLAHKVQVRLRYGNLNVEWDQLSPIRLSGPATFVFEGEIRYPFS